MDKGYLTKDDLDELDALRIENDLLRRKLKEFEAGLTKIEVDTARRQENPELDNLQNLMTQINAARKEVTSYGDQRAALEGDVAHLHGLLQKARAERGAFVELVRRAEAAGEAHRQRARDAAQELEAERAAFARLVRRDRAAAERRLGAAERAAVRRGLLLQDLLSHAKACLKAASSAGDQDLAALQDEYAGLHAECEAILEDPTALSDMQSKASSKKKSKKKKKKNSTAPTDVDFFYSPETINEGKNAGEAASQSQLSHLTFEVSDDDKREEDKDKDEEAAATASDEVVVQPSQPRQDTIDTVATQPRQRSQDTAETAAAGFADDEKARLVPSSSSEKNLVAAAAPIQSTIEELQTLAEGQEDSSSAGAKNNTSSNDDSKNSKNNVKKGEEEISPAEKVC